MPSFAVSWKKAAIAAAVTLSCTAPGAQAGDVTLKSTDGSFDLRGELIGFEDNHYTVKTLLGEFRVNAERVRCEGAACPTFDLAEADVRFAGSDSVSVGLMPLLMTGYAGHLGAELTVTETGDPGQFISNLVADEGYGDALGTFLVTPGSTADAFLGLLDGTADVGLASRRITPNEAKALREAGAGNMIDPGQEHIFAVDSLVVIAHPDNPVTQVSMQDMRDIYAGRITNWKALGGGDVPIEFIGRADDSGTRQTFEEKLFGDNTILRSPSHRVAETNIEMAALVNANPGAVGFVPFAFQRGAKPLDLVNSCGIVTSPDAFTAKTGEYPLQRRLYLYDRADNENPDARAFLDYALSDAADDMIAKAGFINLGIERKPQGLDGGRANLLSPTGLDEYEAGIMTDLIDTMSGYDRLSTTFRFLSGSSDLDERGVKDLSRLIEFLGTQPDGVKVAVVGFTDNVGTFDSNRDLSQRRAQSVLDTLLTSGGSRLAGIEFETFGFGELASSGCNLSETGRAINRRVEVWIASGVGG